MQANPADTIVWLMLFAGLAFVAVVWLVFPFVVLSRLSKIHRTLERIESGVSKPPEA